MSALRTLESQMDGKQVRVFVVEDNAADVFWLEMVFKGARVPYVIQIAGDGQTAKSYLMDTLRPGPEAPDLILLNGNLEGSAATEILDCAKDHSAIPLFMISSVELPAALRDRVGADYCLQKPFTHDHLLCCLASIASSPLELEIPA